MKRPEAPGNQSPRRRVADRPPRPREPPAPCRRRRRSHNRNRQCSRGRGKSRGGGNGSRGTTGPRLGCVADGLYRHPTKPATGVARPLDPTRVATDSRGETEGKSRSAGRTRFSGVSPKAAPTPATSPSRVAGSGRVRTPDCDPGLEPDLTATFADLESVESEPFSPTIGVEKHDKTPRWGREVPEGRMRGSRVDAAPSPQPSPPQWKRFELGQSPAGERESHFSTKG